ncbi:MAG: WD40/YVTN/BNR-like repeat-containing protein [Bacteroidales bacterium]
MKNLFSTGTIITATLLLIASCSTQEPASEERITAFNLHVQMEETTPVKGEWTFIGPEIMSGRISDVDVPAGSDSIIYAASASGGIWKSGNGGTTWFPVMEKEASSSVGDIAIAPSDPDIIYAGMGEANAYRSGMSGTGMYRSSDAGNSWTYTGLAETGTIGRVIVHPANPDIVYVAAAGKTWINSPDRGVYRTIDGGLTWDKIFYLNEGAGCIDLVMDPSDPDLMIAAMWNRKREKWNNPYPGDNDGVYRTTDGGTTWEELTTGLPDAADAGRIGLDFSESNPDVVYAVIDNHASTGEERPDGYGRGAMETVKYGCEVYRSNDKGVSWKKVSPQDEFMERVYNSYGYIFGQIVVDPSDENHVFVLGVPLIESGDGGITWNRISYQGLHSDHHALWVSPSDPDYIINGNDGGINISRDGGKTFHNVENMGVVQYYNLGFDNREPFNIYGSIQDNGSYMGPVTHRPGIDPANQWKRCPGGEASFHQINPDNNNILYSAGFYGTLSRSEWNGEKWETEIINPENEEGESMQRGQWLAPFLLSHHDYNTVYLGKQSLYRTRDEGRTWEKISDDLTLNDTSKTGDINYQTIFAIGESPLTPGILYCGTDDGRLHVTRNDGETWSDLTGNLPEKMWVSRVVPSRYSEGRVYVALNGKRDEDYRALIYKSEDYGNTWEKISDSMPDAPVNVIREDLQDSTTIYAGTDIGVYVSNDPGKEWNVMGKNLPTVYVHDLKIHPRDNIIVIATHGRGLWKYDLN